VATLGQRIVDIAASQVGLVESPLGSNKGPISKYGALYGTWMSGEPWCAAFVGWCWTQAGVDDALSICTPSCQTNCNISDAKGLRMSPRPGASIVWCGKHTGLLVEPLGGGLWRTCEGNTNHSVAFRTHDLSGVVIYGPAGLAGEAAGAVPRETVYYLEDVRVKTFGPWPTKVAREAEITSLPKERQGKVRRVRIATKDGKTGYGWCEGPPRRYWGPFVSKKARKKARGLLEARLGVRLRPFAQRRVARIAGEADPLGETRGDGWPFGAPGITLEPNTDDLSPPPATPPEGDLTRGADSTPPDEPGEDDGEPEAGEEVVDGELPMLEEEADDLPDEPDGPAGP
jgi:hypothetical protein